MGHRCNYVIREGGKVELFYSHWGALSVPQDVFWGPGFAEAFIRQNDPAGDGDWLDEAFAEGGVALDKDSKTVVLFGGEAFYGPPLQEPFLELMTALWSHAGWTVTWAKTGQPEIARAVGVDPASVGIDPAGIEDDFDYEGAEATCSFEQEPPPATKDEAYAKVFKVLLNEERLDAKSMMMNMLSKLQGEVQVAPGALTNPQAGTPDSDTAQALISLALSVVKEQAGD